MNTDHPIDPTGKSVLIVDDLVLVGHSLKHVLHHSGRFEEIWQAQNGEDACVLVEKYQPTLVLLGIDLSGMSGLEAASQIKQIAPKTKIIMMSSSSDEIVVRAAMKLELNGFCSKEADFQQLLLVIDKVLAGGIGLDYGVAQVVKEIREADRQKSLVSHSLDHRVHTNVLTPTELELLSLIADYHSNEEIAAILKLSDAWIDAHIQTILKKLEVETEAQAVRKALEDGVIERSRMVDQDFAI